MNPDLNPIFSCSVGIDVHHNKLVVCILHKGENGEMKMELREFGGFKRDRREMAQWIASYHPEVVVMESTGVYWKSPYHYLELKGVRALVVNARHVKGVPGRKTDICDAQWLAMLARAGLLKGSFVPPQTTREHRLIARHLKKQKSILEAEKNRVHKVLADGGIRLSVVVSDLHGKSARKMIKGLLAGETPEQVLRYADKRLKATKQELLDALEGELTEAHCLVVSNLLTHIEYLEQNIHAMQQRLVQGMAEQKGLIEALQTIPGVDELAALLLLAEIGDDMEVFSSPERLAAWAGVCPANNESAGKHKAGKKRKGNPWVRRILCEVAQAASKTRSSLATKFKALSARRGHKKAIFALAHKILKIIFHLIARGGHYRDAAIDYQALTADGGAFPVCSTRRWTFPQATCRVGMDPTVSGKRPCQA